MKKYRSFPFTAPEQAWVLGGKTKLTFTGFVETSAENEKRTIIDGFEIFCRVNVTVVGSFGEGDPTVIAGADLYKMFGSITVEQKDGVKRYDEITGDALRVSNYAVLGWERTREHPDVPITTSEEGDTPITLLISAYVPLRKEFADEPNDFAMPADVFNFIRIKMAEDSDFVIAGGGPTLTINNAQYWVSADCHAESTAKTYAVDTITMADFETTNAVAATTKMNMTGRPHDLLMYVPGSNGGELLSGLTEALVVDIYQQSQLIAPDLVTRYARERDVVQGLAGSQGAPWRSDPFVPEAGSPDVPRAVALLLATGNHPDEGPVRENLTVKIRSTSSPGTLRLIARVLQERSDKLDAAQAKKFAATGVTPDRDPNKKKIAPKDAKFFPGKLTR